MNDGNRSHWPPQKGRIEELKDGTVSTMRVTINDIAKASGFSKTSVSFAFNEPQKISSATRDKILKVAEDLGYVPDPLARNLSTRKIGTIGFLLPQSISKVLENPYMNEVLIGIGQVCEQHSFSLTLVPPLHGCIEKGVRNAAVDGFITLGLQPEMKVVQLIRNRHVPFVTMDGNPDEAIPSVNIDDEGAGYTSMKTVLNMGHRRIAVFSLEDASDPEEVIHTGVGDFRSNGELRALREFGLNEEDIISLITEASPEGGRLAARNIFSRPREEWPSAIVCHADVVALGVQQELDALGISVPADVSLVGFDDIPEAAMMHPRLTTVRQPGREKGRTASEMLFKLMAGETFATHVTYNFEFILRESLGMPKLSLR